MKPRASRSFVVSHRFTNFIGNDLLRFLLFILLITACEVVSAQVTPSQLIESKTDLLGEAALREPDGPSYEFFENVLPPLRYVDARYKHYPIVLAAPRSQIKGKVL